MASFAYTAVARDGKRTSGTLAADSRAAAIAQVVEKGLHPVSVDEKGNGNGAANGNGHDPNKDTGKSEKDKAEKLVTEIDPIDPGAFAPVAEPQPPALSAEVLAALDALLSGRPFVQG